MKKSTSETDQLVTEQKPCIFKASGKSTAVIVGDPSVVIIEAHDALGFLLSDSCYDSMVGTKIHFENVNWVRQVYQTGKKAFRTFSEVALFRYDSGPFVVQDMVSQNYLPCPSKDPYIVTFLSKDQYDELHEQIQKEDVENLMKSLKSSAREMSGLYFKENTLIAPATYAHATSVRLNRPVMDG